MRVCNRLNTQKLTYTNESCSYVNIENSRGFDNNHVFLCTTTDHFDEIMAFFASLRLKEFGFSSSRQSSTSSSTTSLCSRHSRNSTISRDSKIKPIKMEGLMEIMLKPVQTYKLPVKKKSVNNVSNLQYCVDLIAIY